MKKLEVFAMVILVLSMVVCGFAQEQKSNGDVEWDDGVLKFKSEDGNFMTRFDVRFYANAAHFLEGKNELSSGTHLRKGRFAMKTKLWKVWRVEWDIDIAEGIVETKDMFVSYTGFNNSHIKVGHFKMPLGLNELTTSRYQVFIERAYPMLAFEVDRRAGIEYSRWGERFNIRTAIFGQTMDDQKNKTKDETGGGFAARGVYTPIQTEDMILHTGLAYAWENPDNDNDAVEVKTEPETKMGDVEIFDTGNIFDVDFTHKIGLEGAFSYKNFLVQSEYIQSMLMRFEGVEDAVFSGAYVYGTWVLTGERRKWDKTQGEFGHIIPKDNKLGAWEVAVRYSNINLTDEDALILGGKGNNITVGLNWYPNPNLKWMLNYTNVSTSKNATGEGFEGNDDFGVIHAMLVAYF
jgi:phosphate-selective porin OprO/OprP